MMRAFLTSALVLLGAGVGIVAAQPVTVNEPAVCFRCHSEMESLGSKKHVHTAYDGEKCSQCHNPHASRHAALLGLESGRLCLSCHEDVEGELHGASVHPPVLQGSCTSCHDPHASDFPSQLKKREVSLCSDCHAPVEEWLASPVVHEPLSDGDCQACHESHGSEVGSLLTDGVPALCFECHTADASFAKAHRRRNIRESDCTACHDPHSGSLPGLLRKNQHKPFAGGECSRCHGDQTSDGTFTIAGDVKPLCNECHRGLDQFEEKAFHGHLTEGESCLSCHNSHASNVDALLAAEQKVLCMRCHFNEAGRKEKSAYLTHDGMDCVECHAPHGSDNRQYLNSLEVDLCARCHEGAHRVSHPVGPDIIDVRTDEPVTCLSCHTLHGSGYENYLTLDPEMDLCIQCHKR